MALESTPAAIVITDPAKMAVPKMLGSTVRGTHQNSHHLWKYYAPPHADIAFNVSGTLAAETTWEWGIDPSADSLNYDARLVVETSQATTINWSFDTGGGPDSGNEVVGAAGAHTITLTGLTISSAATLAQLVLSTDDGTCIPHHFLLWPAPGDITTTKKASGFTPSHTGLLDETGAPISTEHVGRARANALALLADRKPMVYSFVQCCDGATAAWRQTGSYTTQPFKMGPSRIYLPGQGLSTQTLSVYCRATTTGVATADLVALRQIGIVDGAGVSFDADDTDQTSTLSVKVQGSGLRSYVDLELEVMAANTKVTTVEYMVAYWRPLT